MIFGSRKKGYTYYANYNLQQGSTEWRNWRKKVIGASDAPTIMGENPFASSEYLISEKMGLRKEFQGNAITREGQRLEVDARKWLAKEFKINLTPVILQDGITPYLAASLDAISEDHSQVFEIKCGAKSYELAYQKSKIPDYYYGQLQHILMISQLEMLTYAAYRPDSDLILIEVERDSDYITRLRYQEENFVSKLKDRGHKMQKTFIGTPYV